MGANEELYLQNERKANYYTLNAMMIYIVLGSIGWMLNEFDIFDIPHKQYTILWAVNVFIVLVPLIITVKNKGYTKYLKYVMLTAAVLLPCSLVSLLGYNMVLFVMFPILLSCHYFSEKLTIFTVAATVVGLLVANIVCIYHGLADFNNMAFYDGVQFEMIDQSLVMSDAVYDMIDYKTSIFYMLQYIFVPEILCIAVLSPICYKISTRSRQMVNEQKEITEKAQNTATELAVAEHIQTGMLPKILPSFPNRPEFDIAASMKAAKEVGGDFYDFFFTDSNHFVFIIADVSGKGIPASLFMTVTKSLIKSRMQDMKTPSEAFVEVNKQICEGNDQGMFITAWMGCVDLTTGVVDFVNAGHNPPVFKHGGSYNFMREKPNFVLGEFDTINYNQHQFTMKSGDILYLYTDGVTEAMNSERKLYGDARLETILNANLGAHTEEVLSLVTNDVNSHVDGAVQSDDITMLVIEWK